MKSLLIGSIPVGLFMYLGVFHTYVFVYALMIGGLTFAAYCIGEAVREEFGDRRD